MKHIIALVLATSIGQAVAAERTYVRWLPVAFHDGINNPPSYVGKALPPGQACEDEVIKKIRKQHRIPDSVTVACKPWTPKSEDNL